MGILSFLKRVFTDSTHGTPNTPGFPAENLRSVFEGMVISIKTNDYYDRLLDDGSTYDETRMTVKTDEGWTLNGRIPNMYRGETPEHLKPAVGKRVVFRAYVRRSPRDPYFGFFDGAFLLSDKQLAKYRYEQAVFADLVRKDEQDKILRQRASVKRSRDKKAKEKDEEREEERRKRVELLAIETGLSYDAAYELDDGMLYHHWTAPEKERQAWGEFYRLKRQRRLNYINAHK
jgi:hypothetical protein